MQYAHHDLILFWLMPWSKGLREVTERLTLTNPPLWSRREPDEPAPRWVRPLFLQQWVGEALAARADWMEAHASRIWRFGEACVPRWDGSGYERPERRCLRGRGEAALLEQFARIVERLLRVMEEVPKMVDEGEWTCEALRGSEQIAQLYAILRRRCGAARAREMLRAELRRFVEWSGEEGLRAGD